MPALRDGGGMRGLGTSGCAALHPGLFSCSPYGRTTGRQLTKENDGAASIGKGERRGIIESAISRRSFWPF
jgi:hypothetical protein